MFILATAKNTRKTTTRKRTTTTKPVEEKVEVAQEEVVEEPKVIKRKKQIDLDMLVSCKNIVDGRLIYKSRKTGLETIWMEYGDVEFIDVGELLTMKASQPKFLTNPALIIEDDDVVEYLGLKHIYQKIVDVEDLDTFFENSPEEISQILDKIPNGVKGTIGTVAKKRVLDGTLFDRRKIKTLEQKLNIDLSE